MIRPLCSLKWFHWLYAKKLSTYTDEEPTAQTKECRPKTKKTIKYTFLPVESWFLSPNNAHGVWLTERICRLRTFHFRTWSVLYRTRNCTQRWCHGVLTHPEVHSYITAARSLVGVKGLFKDGRCNERRQEERNVRYHISFKGKILLHIIKRKELWIYQNNKTTSGSWNWSQSVWSLPKGRHHSILNHYLFASVLLLHNDCKALTMLVETKASSIMHAVM